MSNEFEELRQLASDTLTHIKEEYDPPAKKPAPPVQKKPVAPAQPMLKQVEPSKNPMLDSIQKHLPHIQLKKEPPQREKVAILVLDEQEIPFLKNLAKAIDTRLCPVKLIDGRRLKNPGELNFKTLIVSKSCTLTFSSEVALIPLDPIEEYENNVELKKELWSVLCQKLKTA